MQTCQMESDGKIYLLQVETNATGASHANTDELKGCTRSEKIDVINI